MFSIRRSRAVVLLLLVLSALTQADPTPPTEGYELGDPASGINIIFPLSMTQCDPFLVYYNVNTTSPFIAFYTPDLNGDALLTLLPPAGSSGYIDWICDIPAGHELIIAVRVAGVLRMAYYTVQSGESSTCIVPLTTTYSILNYGTNFAFYTAGDEIYPIVGPGPSTLIGTSTSFPASSLPTITANPDLIVQTTTSTLPSSLSSSPQSFSPFTSVPSPSPSSMQSNGPSLTQSKNITTKLAAALSIVVGIFVIALGFSLWRCSQRSKQMSRGTALVSSEGYSGPISNGWHSERQPLDDRSNSSNITAPPSSPGTYPIPGDPGRDAVVEILASQLTDDQRRALLVTLTASGVPRERSSPIHGQQAVASSSYRNGTRSKVSPAQSNPSERPTFVSMHTQPLASDEVPSGSDVDVKPAQPPPYEI